MPPLPAAAGVLKVSIPLTIDSDTAALNRFYVHYAGSAPTSADASTFAQGVEAAWGADLAPLHNTLVHQQLVQVEDLSSSTGAVGIGTTPHVGTRAGDVLTGGVCAIVEFKINRRYRGGKPKVFLPAGIRSDIQSMQTWNNTFIAALQSGWAAFMAGVLSSGWTGASTLTHVNVSYYSGFTVVTDPTTHRARNKPTLRGTPTVDTVVAYGIETGIGSQRRRNMV